MLFKSTAKKNKSRLESYKKYILSIIEDKSTTRFTDKERINGINKIHKILLSSIQQDLFETLSKSTHPLKKHDRYFIEEIRMPNCRHCKSKYNERTLYSLDNPIQVFLNTDPVLSFPWDKERLLSLQRISYRTGNPFKHDSLNHKMTFIYPINTFFIFNGMHSAFAGIYDRAAYSYSTQMIDISSFYNHYYFDGTHFRHNDCNRIINTPEHPEIGILYELGRIYLEKHLDFWSYYNTPVKSNTTL